MTTPSRPGPSTEPSRDPPGPVPAPAADALARRALEPSDVAEIRFQPIVSLETGRVVGCEALTRWVDEDGVVFGPSDLADTVLEQALDDTADTLYDSACRALAAMNARRGDETFLVTLNASPAQLGRAPRMERLFRAIARHGVRTAQLCVELTEQSALVDHAAVVDAVRRLRAAGLSVALDDFGTGHAQLRQLAQLPVDTIKIAQCLVEGVEDRARDRAIVAGVIRLGEALGLRCVAEGIETTREADLLRALGCDLAQGFHFSEAVPLEELELLEGRVFASPARSRIAVVVLARQRSCALAVAAALDDEAGIEVLCAASDAEEAEANTSGRPCDVVVAELGLAPGDPLEEIAALRARWPTAKLVLLDDRRDERVLPAAIEAGCAGVVGPQSSLGDLVAAVHTVAAGHVAFAPEQLSSAVPQLRGEAGRVAAGLTRRERDVLQLLAAGTTTQAIARELYLSRHTVRNHIQTVLQKLGVHDRLTAVIRAVELGIVSVPRPS